jgi:hypothetical protein
MIFASISNLFLFFHCLLHKRDLSLHCSLSLYYDFDFPRTRFPDHVNLVLSFDIALVSLIPNFIFDTLGISCKLVISL